MNSIPPDPAIRRAELQDAPAVKRCIDRAYAPVKQRLADLPEVSAGIEEDITDQVVFVAVTGTAVAGCAVLSVNGPVAHLMNVAVDPDFKGRGIGGHLIGAVEGHAQEAGCKKLRLATHVGMPENVQLYMHLGWSETGRTGNKVLMSKSL